MRWRFAPDDAIKHVRTAPDRIVVNVGKHDATIQLRLGATDLETRMELEQKISDLFLSSPMRPGVLLTDVVACPVEFLAAWELDEDEWRNEMAFDRAYYSVTKITGIIPALATRLDAPIIYDLQLGFTQEFDAATFGPPDVEVVTIAEDGTISPA